MWKIKLPKLSISCPPKSAHSSTTLATLSTANSPPKHHNYGTFFSKTPAKNTLHHAKKNRAITR
jgi:hypothetical protein